MAGHERPNVLLVMTDEERYPPPYESEAVARFRHDHLPARERIRDGGVELHRHYVGSTACLPSRATLFTGQYPSLHGVKSTDGLAKGATDPAMTWLDPDTVPTLGDWFRAGGYATHYRGKWHISHADLFVPGTHDSLMASDAQGNVIPDAVAAYRLADRLAPFGFSGWIGREPHGAAPADTGYVRDGVFAEQVCELFAVLDRDADDDRPWLAVASFVNPHDIAFSGLGWQALGFPTPGDEVPAVAEPPSQSDGFDDRPTAQREWKRVWPEMLYEQPTDEAYRRFYLWLHLLVDRAIGRVLDALAASRFADDTIVVFTSDHGDLVGAHGGLQQKWYNAYDEATHVPLVVRGPGIEARAGGIDLPTSHLDLLPTLLGLAGIDAEAITPAVAEHHVETRVPVGRDLSDLLRGRDGTEADPLYFMTDDDICRGLRQRGLLSRTPYEPVAGPTSVESVIATLPTGAGGADELWKCNRFFDPATLADDDPTPDAPSDEWELYNLTADPGERTNLEARRGATFDHLVALLETERERKRLRPRLVNPVPPAPVPGP